MIAWRAAAALAAASLVQAAPAAAPEWSATSAGYALSVSDTDIVVTRGIKMLFSAKAWVRADHAQAVRDAEGDAVRTEHRFSMVSIAGPYLSLRDETYLDITPSAHPGGETRLWTIDLRRLRGPGMITAAQAVDLKSLVGEAPLRRALLADPVVRTARPRPNASLDDIRLALPKADFGKDTCFDVPEDWTSRFVLRGWDKGRLLVRLGLPGLGPCRYNLTQLGLTVAAPPTLRKTIGPVHTAPPARTVKISFTAPARH
ncbi:hypothetical protein ACSBM8_00790 [Sphingomonas sp. ASY06-1R]|uniref:hypothetical protein n=1 Tax=Sphingomonas sp. ASY06-1R TaxID=3445771 RepID=UPI003FA1BCAB